MGATPVIAALPMYDWPELRPATDKLWNEIGKRLHDREIRAPGNLTRGRPEMDIWKSTELLLAQTCGLPYALDLKSIRSLIGTPAYELGCNPGSYYSTIVVRKTCGIDDLSRVDQSCFAYNTQHSQSGFAAFGHALNSCGPNVAPARFLCTGSHRQSIRAVAGGSADLASIDAVSWELALRHEPAAKCLRVLLRTDPTPGLPLISARSADEVEEIGTAVEEAVANLDLRTRQDLLITGFVRSHPGDYDTIAARYAAISATPFFSAVQ